MSSLPESDEGKTRVFFDPSCWLGPTVTSGTWAATPEIAVREDFSGVRRIQKHGAAHPSDARHIPGRAADGAGEGRRVLERATHFDLRDLEARPRRVDLYEIGRAHV